jgi:hypothetical protein
MKEKNMKEALVRGVLKRVGIRPLERLAWAVDFAQRPLLTTGDLSNAELELTCFLWAPHLPEENRPTQISALMSGWGGGLAYQGQEVSLAQQRFVEVLRAAAGDEEIEIPLKNITVQFTRGKGVKYASTIPDRVGMSATQRTEAKLEAVVFKLLRLLDQTVRTSLAKARGGERFLPLRLYVGICPTVKDGCGKLFAKTRIDQDYCSRTCASRAQVRRFRKKKSLR